MSFVLTFRIEGRETRNIANEATATAAAAAPVTANKKRNEEILYTCIIGLLFQMRNK